MTPFTRIFFLVLVAVTFALPAYADDLSDAKRAGQVGERTDGYLGIVGSNESARPLVNRINAARKAEYEKIAAKNGQTVEVVEKLAASKVFEAAPSGTYLMDSTGGWRQK